MSSPQSSPTPAPLFHLGHPQGHIPLFDPPDLPSAPVRRSRIALFAVAATAVAFLGTLLEHLGEGASAHIPDVSLPWVLPFALLLAAIATMPFIAKHFWERYYWAVALVLAAIVAVYYVFVLPAPGVQGGFLASRAGRSVASYFGEYVSFIFLLGSLYTVSGGILIRVRRKATPTVNTLLLLTGAIVANIFGTTGAAMLLIRPFLRINKGHLRPFHVVFFIFSVANVGGALTPIGDPPLFLGYLKGVPFWWVWDHCWPMWALAVGILLVIFFVLDTLAQRKEPRQPHPKDDMGPVVSIYGVGNLLLVVAILAGVLRHEMFHQLLPIPWRELIMVAAMTVSLLTTPRRIHVENVFNFAPIREVALLFIGIFATMVPALNYLQNHAHDPALERYLHTPGQFYYTAGTLSSVLDNAPTYLTFLETELGKLDKNLIQVASEIVKDPNKNAPDKADYERLATLNAAKYASDPAAAAQDRKSLDAAIAALREYHGEKVQAGTLTADQIRIGFLLGAPSLNAYLVAISLGAVFFGACTYIGNGPNFMVKSIAENAGAKTPSFFGYILCYTLPILLPTLILVWAIFLR